MEQTNDNEQKGIEQEVFQLVNGRRRENSLESLKENQKLATAAREQAERCAKSGILSKECHKYGGSLGDRMRRAQYDFSKVGENLSSRRTAEAIVTGWMNSTGHRRNILKPEFVDTGVGIAVNGRLMITCQIYATPQRVDLRESLESSSVTIEIEVTELPDNE